MADAAPALLPGAALAALWHAAGLPAEALPCAALPGSEPVLPSSFAVATAAQASLGAAGLAAAELWHLRRGGGERQRIEVDRRHAALDSCAYFLVDGRQPELWDPLSGLYPCGPAGESGWVRIHANFAHHRDGALRLLGLPAGPAVERAEVLVALREWDAEGFEAAAAEAGLVVAAARSFEQWDAHLQGQAVAAQPLLRIERIAGAPPADPRRWPALPEGARPLHGLRVLDLTRILAGPVASRTLAAYGADVLLVNAPHLPNIAAIADTSRGKRSAHADLRTEAGREAVRALVEASHVFVQGYRPGALEALGFGPQALAQMRPGIVAVSLSAYGAEGPWAGRRGFDSLVQTATGFNLAEALAAGEHRPRALPMQILDYAAGYLLAFGTQAALWRQQQEGGSWHVQLSLAGVGRWLRGLGRVAGGLAAAAPPFEPYLQQEASGFGELTVLRHPVAFSATPAGWDRPAMPPGTHSPSW
ncbi:CoA transferase [Aquincola sp. MAHUQ-54]|uniref:CoA transferase n=1 Tax=Aquincola agrisoli TaxID=3119538 RepID=A0AAW9QNF8_9BURK